MINELVTIYKVIGAVLGGLAAIVFLPPANIREFVRRISLSIVCGIIFASPLLEYTEFEVTTYNIIASAFSAALFSWWFIGACIRILGVWKGGISKK